MTTETKPDMVDRLRDEADLCRNEGATDIAVLLDEAADELERLSAQVAQYREDAERYRWLRDTNLDAGVRATGEHLEPLQVPMIFIGHPEDQWTLGSFASAWVGEKFDRAIDAAIDKARKAAAHEAGVLE